MSNTGSEVDQLAEADNGIESESESDNQSDSDTPVGDAQLDENMIDEGDDAGEEDITYGFAETPSSYDLDAWAVTLLPQELPEIFGFYTPVQLASYNANGPKDVPAYANWVLVAAVNSRLLIHPDFCTPLIEAIQAQGHVIIPNTYPLALILGNAQMSISNLVEALETAGVDAVRVTGYGMKHTLDDQLPDIGTAFHPLSGTNRFDFGSTWQSGDIKLFKAAKTFKPMKRVKYPMLVPLGQGHGSVNFTVRWPPTGADFDAYQIKIYSRMIHLLKAGGLGLPKTVPQKFNDLKNRRAVILRKLHDFASYPSGLWGGARVEVSVFASTMHAAREKVMATPLLNIHSYLDGLIPHLHLHCKTISMERVIANARELYRKAEQLKIFIGRGTAPLTDLHKRVALDLSNAIGFNFGRPGNPTRWDHPNPWWSAEYILQPDLCLPSAYVSSVRFREPALELEEMRSIRREMQGTEIVKEYFGYVRTLLVCQMCADGVANAYEIERRNPFRLRCSKAQHNLQGHELREYLIELMIQRLLPTPSTARARAHRPWRRLVPPDYEADQQRMEEQVASARANQQHPPTPPLTPPQPTTQRPRMTVEVVIETSPSRRRIQPSTSQHTVRPYTDSQLRQLQWRDGSATPSEASDRLPTPPPTNQIDIAESILAMHGKEELIAYFLPRRKQFQCPRCKLPDATFNQCHQPSSFRIECRLCKLRVKEQDCKKMFIEYALASDLLA